MKKIIVFLALSLVACTSTTSTDEPAEAPDGTDVSPRLLAATPLPNMTRILPPAAGALMTHCRYTDAGYVCPKDDALLLPAGWRVDQPFAIVLFPVTLAAGETVDVVRGKVSCPPGSTAKMSLKANDPDVGWERTVGSATAACTGATEDLDLDVTGQDISGTSLGFRMITVSFTASQAGAYVRGVELATH